MECIADMGDPIAHKVDGAMIASARARWIASGVTGKTANNRLSYLTWVYEEKGGSCLAGHYAAHLAPRTSHLSI